MRSIVITLLITVIHAVLSASLDDHSMWDIFTNLEYNNMESFAIANPQMLQDENVRALIQCKRNFVCAFRSNPNRLLFMRVPSYLRSNLIRHAAIQNDQHTVKQMIKAGIDEQLLHYPLKRALRLGLDEQAQWIREYLPYSLRGISVLQVNPDIDQERLLVACRRGTLQQVQELIDLGADVNAENSNGVTPLLGAIIRGDIEIMKALIEVGADVDALYHGRRLLRYAAGYGRYEIVRVIIDAGADVNFADNDGMTPLMTSANRGRVEVLNFLIEAGADVNAKKRTTGETALMIAAARKDSEEAVRVLIKAGADVNAKNSNGQTILMEAVNQANVVIVETLIECGADLDAVDNNDWTAVMIAAFKGRFRIFKILLEAGASIHHKDRDGLTVLMIATGLNRLQIVEWLIEVGVDLDAKSNEEKTALMMAATYGNAQIVKALLEAGADLEARDDHGETALMKAEEGSQIVDIIKGARLRPVIKNVLIPKSRVISQQDPHLFQKHSIRRAAIRNDQQAVEVLIEAGVDSKWLDYPLKRALRLGRDNQAQWIRSLLPSSLSGINVVEVNYVLLPHSLTDATRQGLVDQVQALIRAGGDVNLADDQRDTALIIAAAEDQLEIVKILIEAGADVDGKDYRGETALMKAARNGCLEVARVLIAAGADVNIMTFLTRYTAIYLAVKEHQLGFVNLLIESGADVNTKHNGGVTALIKAASFANTDVIKSLIAAGANVNAKDHFGQTALMKAALHKRLATIRLLIEAGAQTNAKVNTI